MPEDIVIERLGPADHDRARVVRLRALGDAPDAFWTTLAEEEQRPPALWRERLAAADSATFVAHRGGVDVGLVVGAPHRGQEGDAGLFSMWVAPEARRAGVADALMSAVIGRATGGTGPCAWRFRTPTKLPYGCTSGEVLPPRATVAAFRRRATTSRSTNGRWI